MAEVEIKVKIDGIEYTQDQLKDLASGAKKAANDIEDVKDETKKAADEQGYFSKKIDEVKDKFKGLKAGFGDLKKGYAVLQGGLTKMARGFGLSSKMATLFGKSASAALAATGIGLIVPLVLALVNYFTNLEAGAKFLKKGMAALGAVIANIGDVMKSIISLDFAGAFKTLVGSVSEATAAVDQQFEAEKKLAALRNKTIIENAQLNATIEANKKVLEDTTLSLDERIKALDGVTSATKTLAENQIKETQLALSAAEAQLVLTNNYEERREKQLEIAELQASLIDQQTQLANVEYDAEKVAREIRTAAADERKAQIAESLAQQKTVYETLRDLRINDIVDEQSKAEATLQVNREASIQTLKDNGASKAQILEAEKLFNTQLETLRQEYADKESEKAIAAKEKKAAADLAELEAEKAKQEQLKAILDQAYFESIENEFQRAQEELLREEQAAMAELDLLNATEEQKQKIEDSYSKKRKKLAKDEADYKAALAKQQIQNDLELAMSAFSAISNLLGQESAAGKASAVAAATISTYLGAQKAYTSQMTLTPDSPIRAAIAASVAIATGIGNIRAIVATPTPGGGGGGGGSVPTAPTIPTFNGNTGSMDLGSGPNFGDSNAMSEINGIDNTGDGPAPVRAYVVATEMTTRQEANKKVEDISRL